MAGKFTYEAVCFLRKQGKTQKEIGEIFGVNRMKVQRIMNYYVPFKRARKQKLIQVFKIKKPSKNRNKITSGGRDCFREKIRARDKWTCQICSKKWIEGNRRFDIHHLDEKMDGKSKEKGIGKYDREHPDKLITLCHQCHFSLDVTRNKMLKGIRQRKSALG